MGKQLRNEQKVASAVFWGRSFHHLPDQKTSLENNFAILQIEDLMISFVNVL